MPKTYFVIASYYGGFEPLMIHLRTLPGASSAVLTHEQHGEEREVMGFARVYNILVNAAFSDPVCERVWLLGDDVMPIGFCLVNTESFLISCPSIGVICPLEVKEVHPRNAVEATVQQLYAAFACACITREAWKRVGPIDETLGRGYAEDLDWGIRCWKAGLEVVGYRREVFLHQGGSTYNRLVKEGKYDSKEPEQAAARVKAKYPFLWSGQTDEQIITKLMHERL